MKTKHFKFEGFVGITKQEVVSVDPFGKKANILILQSNKQPGYYSISGFPEETKSITESSFYLVLNSHLMCCYDKLLRKIQKIRVEFPGVLSFCMGELEVDHQTRSCIRVTTSSESALNFIIEGLKVQGVVFHPFQKIKDQTSRIYFKKFEQLELLSEGIYKNELENNEYFLEIPQEITWEEFVVDTENVRNNCKVLFYDAALSTIQLRHCRFIDCIRIFAEFPDLEGLKDLKKHYQKEIGKRIVEAEMV
jgi:hypothetical protein